MCTRIFDNRFAGARTVGRTLDWEVSDEARLWLVPPGLEREGHCDHPVTWSVRHRNLAMTMWNAGTTEGVNDAGLAAHLLYFATSDFGPRDDRPGLSMVLWAQYLIDTCATVTEALATLDAVQIVQIPIRDQLLGAHLALEDASGDAAIVEFIGGAPVVHHGPEFRVMANDPSFDDQVASLARYAPWGGTEELPGNIVSPQRFARATYYLEHLTEPTNAREAVAGVMSIGRNVSVPFGAPYDDFSVYPTWWASVIDVTSRTYYFQSTLAPNVVWASLSEGPLADTTDVLSCDPTDPALVGDIGAQFAPTPPPY